GDALPVGLDEVQPPLPRAGEDDVEREGLTRVRDLDRDVDVAGQPTGRGHLGRGEQLAVGRVTPQLDVAAGGGGDPQQQPVDVEEVDRVVGRPRPVLAADGGAVALDVT